MRRRPVGAVAGPLVLFIGGLAFNTASGHSRWPGPLDLVRVRPWPVLLLLIPLALFSPLRQPRADSPSRPAAPPTYRLWPRNTHVTGRDATCGCCDGAILAVHGLGGAGKSRLAAEYAYRSLLRRGRRRPGPLTHRYPVS